MAKLNKIQAQAIINKLARIANATRDEKIKQAKESYIPSEDLVGLTEVLLERDQLRSKLASINSKVHELLDKQLINIVYYDRLSAEDIIETYKDKEIKEMFPKINLDDAMDDLIVASIENDFDADSFIEHYLNK